MMLDEIQKRLIEEVADLHEVPEGAYNIRANGQMAARNTTANIDIVTKEDGSGIDIRIAPGTRHESVHIPVVLSQSGIRETVYNAVSYTHLVDIILRAKSHLREVLARVCHTHSLSYRHTDQIKHLDPLKTHRLLKGKADPHLRTLRNTLVRNIYAVKINPSRSRLYNTCDQPGKR